MNWRSVVKRLWRHNVLALAAGLACLTALAPAHADQRGIAVVPIRDAHGHKVGLYQDSFALAVGVSRHTNGWPSPPGVVKDVCSVPAGLERAGFRVTVVRDPTHQQLDNAINRFISRGGYSRTTACYSISQATATRSSQPIGRAVGLLCARQRAATGR